MDQEVTEYDDGKMEETYDISFLYGS